MRFGQQRNQHCTQQSHPSFAVPPKIPLFGAGHPSLAPPSLQEDGHIIARAEKYVNLWTDPGRADEASPAKFERRALLDTLPLWRQLTGQMFGAQAIGRHRLAAPDE
jgi:hypothetical protein